MANNLRWGLLSTARINQALIKPLNLSPRNKLAAVASRDLSHAQEYARENNIPQAFGSYEELLSSPEIDVIYNPLPNHMHAEWTVRALQAGKHVLVEKPMALTMAEMDQITDAAQKSGKVVAEAFMYRHHPQTAIVKDLIDTGEIGEVRLMRGTFSFVLDRPDDIRWKPEYGGGATWDIGCYPVSYAHALLDVNPLEVSAWQHRAPSGVDGTLAGVLRYPSDVLLEMSCSFELPGFTVFEVRGTKGTLTIPDPFKPDQKPFAFLKKNGSGEKKISFPSQNLYLGEVENMADAVLEGKVPLISLEESRQNIATLNALLHSAETGQPVKLNG